MKEDKTSQSDITINIPIEGAETGTYLLVRGSYSDLRALSTWMGIVASGREISIGIPPPYAGLQKARPGLGWISLRELSERVLAVLVAVLDAMDFSGEISQTGSVEVYVGPCFEEHPAGEGKPHVPKT